jgi:hypothetical protein
MNNGAIINLMIVFQPSGQYQTTSTDMRGQQQTVSGSWTVDGQTLVVRRDDGTVLNHPFTMDGNTLSFQIEGMGLIHFARMR